MATTDLDAAEVWQLRGPINVGGRVTDMVGDPSNANKFYAGAASGGVWKTTDGGATFTPIFDGLGTSRSARSRSISGHTLLVPTLAFTGAPSTPVRDVRHSTGT